MGLTGDDLGDWLGKSASRALAALRRYGGKSVCFVGGLPFATDDLRGLLPPDCLVIQASSIAVPIDYLVIGHQGSQELDPVMADQLDMSLLHTHHGTRVLPQDGFLDEVLFGYDWWLDEIDLLDHACLFYPGLAYVRDRSMSAPFQWPSTEAQPVDTPHGADDRDRVGETALFRLGYNVSVPTRTERKAILTHILSENLLSLADVVGTIASHCRSRRRQHHGEQKYAKALAEWGIRSPLAQGCLLSNTQDDLRVAHHRLARN